MVAKQICTLALWVVGLIVIGAGIGSCTAPDIGTWYSALNRSPLTPPNGVFPIVWTILYGIIGACGWLIWKTPAFPKQRAIKTAYIIQLFLNWIWTPIFFHYHWIAMALLVLMAMDGVVGVLMILSYRPIRTASVLMIPYLLWILFASYLNIYIWWYH